ncbi:putative cysteine-rich receptor-like protein kinase 20 isoform X2 [Miscanthus floridulus]|uniref:putative cysteine-rich receptor-like protein kinase 20 isoform X2 n=1 Tax=Miscanthus floridulus TaxID=154761 RepID=UPI00345AA4CC
MRVLLLLLAVASSPATASGDGGAAVPVGTTVLSSFCNPTSSSVQRTYQPNSTFAANLQKLVAELPRNASASGFSAGRFGAAGPGAAYGIVLCRGDYLGQQCVDCLAEGFVQAASRCPSSVDATMYYDQCQLRFSDQDFLAGAGAGAANMPESAASNMNKVSAGNTAAFDALVTRLVDAVSDAASNRSARYATGQAGFPPENMNVYALVQCTQDLTTGQCRECLTGLRDQMASLFAGKVGGRILGVRCHIRYEKDVFFAQTQDMLTLTPLLGSTKGSSTTLWIVAVVVPVSVLLACFLACFLWIRKRRRRGRRVSVPTMSMEMEQVLKLWRVEESDSEFSIFDFDQIADATDNFSDDHKLGQGGFGPVYKGELPGGLEIAIKRLSSVSVQGLMEFKTEIQLIAKLQHTNLVRLQGCCVQADEKMLVYEYMHNKSLDFFIFDGDKGKALTWERRFRIIDGVAQGLLYLHKHSRLRVIHRDLKASNILLDRDMNPKISDFGMARIFCSNVTEANTTRVVGTHGYIAPEYASEGLFSIKSDVFSFGVLLLEIISGKRTAGFYQYGKFFNLTGYAYQLWQDGKWHELVDPALGDDLPVSEVTRCVQVALLCVQDSADDRPNMSEVVAMLGSEGVTMPEPRQPAYYNVRITSLAVSSDSFGESSCRITSITLTDHEEGR